jgi:squalene synthase HpnC
VARGGLQSEPQSARPATVPPTTLSGTGPPAGEVTETSEATVAAKAEHENFPVALRLLPARHRRHLMAVYVFARTVDDIGDRAPVADRLGLLDELEGDLRRLYKSIETGQGPKSQSAGSQSKQAPKLLAIKGLNATVTDCAIPIQPFLDLIQANRQDQAVSRYETFEDLAGYCRLSANPVGRIVLYVFGQFTDARAEQSDLVCTALQLAEHWQDIAEDYRDGRIYLPQIDLREYGCEEQDLAATTAPPRLRRLMAFETRRATALLDQGAPLVGTLRGTARLAVAGYVAGGRAALAAIKAADHDCLTATPRPGKARTLAELTAAIVTGR